MAAPVALARHANRGFRGTRWDRVDTLVAHQTGAERSAGLSDFHLFELCLEGHMHAKVEMEMESGDRAEADLVPGTLHFHQSGETGAYETRGSYKVQQVVIADEVFREAAGMIAKGDPDNLKPLGFTGIFDRSLKLLADAMLDEGRSELLGNALYADALAQQIALQILRRRYNLDVRIPPRRRSLSPAELSRVSDYLETHMIDTGGVDTLANLLDMDTFAFTRAFKETTGQAPHQYLIERRIARVKEMLLHDRESLAQIAFATGFSSQSHMTSAFTRRVGMSPGRWRATIHS